MSLRKKLLSGLASSLEWFDFTLYGFLGTIFAKLFFSPNMPAWLNLIETYAIFFIGFAARPVGALIFGHLGDKYGRILPLKLTPILITLASVSLALLPTYEAIGGVATLLLLFTRILQGVFLGGEFAGNIVYLCETTAKWRYLWGSLGSCAGSFGILLSSITASLFYHYMPLEHMYTYGWRCAFLLSIPLGLIAFLVRFNLSESPEFKYIENKKPIILSLQKHKKTALICLGLLYLHATSFYFVFMFLPLLLTQIRHFKESAALLNNSGFLLLHICLIPFFGILVNMYGGFRSLCITALLFIILTVPLFYLISYGMEFWVVAALIVFSAMTAFNAAVIPGLLVETIPTEVRYTVLAFVFNLGFGVFGGITPFLGLLWIGKDGSTMLPWIYLIFVAIITLITGCWLYNLERKNETRKI